MSMRADFLPRACSWPWSPTTPPFFFKVCDPFGTHFQGARHARVRSAAVACSRCSAFVGRGAFLPGPRGTSGHLRAQRCRRVADARHGELPSRSIRSAKTLCSRGSFLLATQKSARVPRPQPEGLCRGRGCGDSFTDLTLTFQACCALPGRQPGTAPEPEPLL